MRRAQVERASPPPLPRHTLTARQQPQQLLYAQMRWGTEETSGTTKAREAAIVTPCSFSWSEHRDLTGDGSIPSSCSGLRRRAYLSCAALTSPLTSQCLSPCFCKAGTTASLGGNVRGKGSEWPSVWTCLGNPGWSSGQSDCKRSICELTQDYDNQENKSLFPVFRKQI